jgi:hypothetical protein
MTLFVITVFARTTARLTDSGAESLPQSVETLAAINEKRMGHMFTPGHSCETSSFGLERILDGIQSFIDT